jgi:hypothetical protein
VIETMGVFVAALFHDGLTPPITGARH